MMVRDICVIPIISLTSRRMRCSGRNDLFVGCDFPVECDGLKGRSKSTRGVRPRPRPGSKEPPRRAVPSRRRERGRSRRPDGDAPPRPRHPAVRRRRGGPPGRCAGRDTGEEEILKGLIPGRIAARVFSRARPGEAAPPGLQGRAGPPPEFRTSIPPSGGGRAGKRTCSCLNLRVSGDLSRPDRGERQRCRAGVLFVTFFSLSSRIPQKEVTTRSYVRRSHSPQMLMEHRLRNLSRAQPGLAR